MDLDAQHRRQRRGRPRPAGTLGIDRDTPVGFQEIRVRFEIDAPGASREQLDSLARKTERYCVVMQTLRSAPVIAVEFT